MYDATSVFDGRAMFSGIAIKRGNWGQVCTDRWLPESRTGEKRLGAPKKERTLDVSICRRLMVLVYVIKSRLLWDATSLK